MIATLLIKVFRKLRFIHFRGIFVGSKEIFLNNKIMRVEIFEEPDRPLFFMQKYATKLRVFSLKGVIHMNYQYKNSIGEVRTATGFVLLKLDSAVKFWKIAANVRRLQIYQMVALDLMVLEEYGGLLI